MPVRPNVSEPDHHPGEERCPLGAPSFRFQDRSSGRRVATGRARDRGRQRRRVRQLATRRPGRPVAPQVAPNFDHGWSSDPANRSLATLESVSLQERLAQQKATPRMPIVRATIDTTPKPGEFRLAPGNLQPAGIGDDSDHGSHGSMDRLRPQ
jgi:hypothetical protein